MLGGPPPLSHSLSGTAHPLAFSDAAGARRDGLWRLDLDLTLPADESAPTPTQASYTNQLRRTSAQPDLADATDPLIGLSPISSGVSTAVSDFSFFLGAASTPDPHYGFSPAATACDLDTNTYMDPLAVHYTSHEYPSSATVLDHSPYDVSLAVNFLSNRSAEGVRMNQSWNLPFNYGEHNAMPAAPITSAPIINYGVMQHQQHDHESPSSTDTTASSRRSSTASHYTGSSASSCSESDLDAEADDDEEDDGDGDFILGRTSAAKMTTSKQRARSLSNASSASSASSACLAAKEKAQPTKRFVCDVAGCDRAFARRYNLMTHVASTHHRNKPFACPECPKTFSRRHDLGRHLGAVHHIKQTGTDVR